MCAKYIIYKKPQNRVFCPSGRVSPVVWNNTHTPRTGAVGGLSVSSRNYLKMNILIYCYDFIFYFLFFLKF